MKKVLFALLLLLPFSLSAQTILNGDMNNDEQVTIADVTSQVNVILGKSPQETINAGGSPYHVDNTSVVGTWYAPDGTNFTLNEDGTTDYGTGFTYKFRPYQGTLMIFNTSGKPVKTFVLNEVESSYLLAIDYATGTYTYYTSSSSMGVQDGHMYVDLSLPTGTLWATCNIGATRPEDYGDYFAWGETEGFNDGKTPFDWSTYKWCKGSSSTMTKYCTNSNYGNNGFTDNLTELETEDDAAYVNWGPAWRMPSIEQIAELINSSYTTTEWTTQNGVNGYLITSKTNGNSIFLPAAGFRADSSIFGTGSVGYYWSRTLLTSHPDYARFLYFLSSGIYADSYSRCSGTSVRPVRSTE